MTEVLTSVVGSGERVFESIGLTQPWMRFLGAAGIAGGILLLTKPQLMFEGDQVRPWSLLVDAEESTVRPTPVPIWIVIIMSGM